MSLAARSYHTNMFCYYWLYSPHCTLHPRDSFILYGNLCPIISLTCFIHPSTPLPSDNHLFITCIYAYFCFVCSLVFWIPHISEIQYLPFSVWLTSLSHLPVAHMARFHSFLWLSNIPLYIYKRHYFHCFPWYIFNVCFIDFSFLWFSCWLVWVQEILIVKPLLPWGGYQSREMSWEARVVFSSTRVGKTKVGFGIHQKRWDTCCSRLEPKGTTLEWGYKLPEFDRVSSILRLKVFIVFLHVSS